MERLKRTDRLVVLSSILTKNPNTLYSLNDLAVMTGAAKSTISEDLTLIKELLLSHSLGELCSLSGAAGGIFYKPLQNEKGSQDFLKELADRLNDRERVIPGGFLYMNDVIFDPHIISRIGEIFYTKFQHTVPDFIVTIETKGIPVAAMTARSFNIPLIIVRNSGRVTEGSSVNINYLSGSTNRIQTMSLARRALPDHAKVLIIDDFMKGGGTAQGMVNLMKEFNGVVVGIGVVMTTRNPEQKLIKDYTALLELISIDAETNEVIIKPFLGKNVLF
ncbi:pur operon repressor [Dehalobacterium formicoaceticum]|uniref:pur operon repressor n=1 Tax=Dehalobacterium formicoaceticum TaxID=51515 RepID=UPI000B7E0B62|nr:pur operon repressor [Dehalobacterium formicoaceticum]